MSSNNLISSVELANRHSDPLLDVKDLRENSNRTHLLQRLTELDHCKKSIEELLEQLEAVPVASKNSPHFYRANSEFEKAIRSANTDDVTSGIRKASLGAQNKRGLPFASVNSGLNGRLTAQIREDNENKRHIPDTHDGRARCKVECWQLPAKITGEAESASPSNFPKSKERNVTVSSEGQQFKTSTHHEFMESLNFSMRSPILAKTGKEDTSNASAMGHSKESVNRQDGVKGHIAEEEGFELKSFTRRDMENKLR